MNKKGYTIPELLIVLGFVTLIAIVSIVKISSVYRMLDFLKVIWYV